MSRHATICKLATLFALGVSTQGCASFSWPKSSTSSANASANKPPSGWTAFTGKVGSLFSSDGKRSSAPPGDPKRIDPVRDSALSVTTKAKAGPDLNVATAGLYEQAQKPREAEKQYRQALEINPKYLPAMEGLARLQDRENHFDEAVATYQKAIALSPQEGRLHNELGLCLHRSGKTAEAVKSLEQAIRLQPERPNYHNNLAMMYLELNRPDAALEQLIAANGIAMGHYNLGYLLMRKGDTQHAVAEFRAAAAIDPTCEPAQQWLAKLDSSGPDGPRVARGFPQPPIETTASVPPTAVAAPPTAVTVAPAAPAPIAPPPTPLHTSPAVPPPSNGQLPYPTTAVRYPQAFTPAGGGVEAPLPAGYGGPANYPPAGNQPPPGSTATPGADGTIGPQFGPSARRLTPQSAPLQ